jgi:hypothetical protein
MMRDDCSMLITQNYKLLLMLGHDCSCSYLLVISGSWLEAVARVDSGSWVGSWVVMLNR